jgi:uncharacterized phiE125 gp8 family phage protein
MGIKVITAPSALLTLAQLRLHLELDTTAGVHAADDLITAQLWAAHEYAEHYTGCSFGSQTLELALDEFPDGPIQLLRGPVTGITSVKYYDADQVLQTMDSADYSLDDYSVPQWLAPAYDTDWPDTLDTPNAVQVRYVAGAATVPYAAVAAIKLIVGHLFANRESVGPDRLAAVPQGAHALLDTLKVYA